MEKVVPIGILRFRFLRPVTQKSATKKSAEDLGSGAGEGEGEGGGDQDAQGHLGRILKIIITRRYDGG